MFDDPVFCYIDLYKDTNKYTKMNAPQFAKPID